MARQVECWRSIVARNFCFLMIRRPPRSTLTDTLFPTRRSTELFLGARAHSGLGLAPHARKGARGPVHELGEIIEHLVVGLHLASSFVAAPARSPTRPPNASILRQDERRVGKECVRNCRSRWAQHN